MRSSILCTAGSIVALSLAGLLQAQTQSTTPAAPPHPHHHLHHALWELRDAHKELKESKHHFGGHKEKAMHAIHAAIKQVELILEHHGDHNVKGAPTRGDLSAEYRKYKHHPHVHHALHEAKHAHHQIEETKHDFAGHREKALHDIHHAIEQIELCLKHYKPV